MEMDKSRICIEEKTKIPNNQDGLNTGLSAYYWNFF